MSLRGLCAFGAVHAEVGGRKTREPGRRSRGKETERETRRGRKERRNIMLAESGGDLKRKVAKTEKRERGKGHRKRKRTAKVKREPKEENGRKRKKEKARKGKRQKGRRGITKRRGGSEETSRTRTGKRTKGRGWRQRRPIRRRKKQDIGRKKEIWRYVITKRTRNTQHTQTGRQTGRQAGAVEPAGRKANKISMSWQPWEIDSTESKVKSATLVYQSDQM